MTERKFTDEQIIKALELHSKEGESCLDECPYADKRYCGSKMAKDALDLIKRQRAGIADLQDENKGLKETNEHLNGEYIALSKEKDNLIRTYAECQKEVIEEFAERLKEELRLSTGNNGGFVPSMIDNLVKEMTEGKQ